jgi:hypothetical protein
MIARPGVYICPSTTVKLPPFESVVAVAATAAVHRRIEKRHGIDGKVILG